MDTLVYRLRRPLADGRQEIMLSPVEFLSRLVDLLAPPRRHRHRYCGVLAPNALPRSRQDRARIAEAVVLESVGRVARLSRLHDDTGGIMQRRQDRETVRFAVPVGARASGSIVALAMIVLAVASSPAIECESYDTAVTMVATMDLERGTAGVVINGDYAFVIETYTGVNTIDISDPSSPRLVATYPLTDDPRRLVQHGDVLFVLYDYEYIRIIDASNPLALETAGTIHLDNLMRIYTEGGFLFAGLRGGSLVILDLGDPTSPVTVGTLPLPDYVQALALDGSHLYLSVADGYDSEPFIRVYDFSDPSAPIQVATVLARQVRGFVVEDGLVYIANLHDGLTIVPAWHPGGPSVLTRISQLDWGQRFFDVRKSGDHLIARVDDGSSYNYSALVIDVSDPLHPWHVGQVETGWTLSFAVQGELILTGQAGNDNIALTVVRAPGHLATPIAAAEGATHYAKRLGIVGTTLFAPAASSRVDVVVVNDPARPNVVASFPAPAARAATVSGDRLYVACATNGVEIYDIAVPWSPQHLGHIPNVDSGAVYDVAAAGSTVYLACHYRGLRIVDASDPMLPSDLATIGTLGTVYGLELSGNCLYVASEHQGLAAVDVSDPSAPVIVSSDPVCHETADLTIADGHLLVADRYVGLRIYDLADPTVPILTGELDFTGQETCVTARHGAAYVGASSWRYGMRIVDYTNPAEPVEIGCLAATGAATDLQLLDDGHVVVVSAQHGLMVAAPWCGTVTAVEGAPNSVPLDVRMSPNPFNPQTTIAWDLSEPANVVVGIYDLRGRLIIKKNLGRVDPGNARMVWDGCDRLGRAMSAGIYLARVSAGGRSAIGRMTLIR
ncbi:MAG TPA: FlgD immunoglobulin-like domain containing protein [Candidatus Krumholzibacteria bacterium]|nr:FlgD immunoglobulin-like domain containing protein [Candidatus Krumholzibacteria bacterium]HPD70200.1 FlgD immunoglobulin-like domain containing protein [Candidatus Krumholzibacteria bacterium]HRY40100.1 FlgD immunoglobulin-like domain containing protein [Candidatus Krumholzibacteria bacterium]